MDIADIMGDMDIHMVMQDTITLENDLLMPNQNQKQKPSHGMDMGIAVMDLDIVLMDMDIVDTDIGVKPSSHYYQSYLRNALHNGCQLSDASTLFTKDILGTCCQNNDLRPQRSNSYFNSTVTILSQLSH